MNGLSMHTQVSKRKLSDRSLIKHSERTTKVRSYNEEYNRSDTDSSISASENNKSDDGEWGHTSKKQKIDSDSQKNWKPKKSTPVKKSIRLTRSSTYHQTSSLYQSLRSSIVKSRSSSSSDDDKWNSLKKKVTPNYSRRKTYSKRLRNKPGIVYHDSGDSSDSESEESLDEKNSNSTGSTSKSSRVVSKKTTRHQNKTRRTLSSQLVNEDSNRSYSSSKFSQENFPVLKRSSRRLTVNEARSSSIQPVNEDSNSFDSLSKSSSDSLSKSSSDSLSKSLSDSLSKSSSDSLSKSSFDSSSKSLSENSLLVNKRSSRQQAARKTRTRHPIQPVYKDSSKSQSYSSSQEDEEEISEQDQDDVDDEYSEDYTTPSSTKRMLLTQCRREVLKKPGRIQTRYRGQRTVQYKEGDSEEEYENGSLPH